MTQNIPIVVVGTGSGLAGNLLFLSFQKRPSINLSEDGGEENLGSALTFEIKAFQLLPEYEQFSPHPHHSLFPVNRQIEIAVQLLCMDIQE